MSGPDHRQEFVREVKELQNIVSAVSADARAAQAQHMRFKTVLEEYQEQPQLLDPHLESLTSPLVEILTECARSLEGCGRVASTMQVCRLLQALVNTRGHKTVVRFFPNKPPDLDRALALMQRVQSMPKQHEVDEDLQDGSWQAQCIMLMWLSSLVLIPFDISTVHIAGMSDGASGSTSAVDWLLSTARTYLADSGPCRCVCMWCMRCTHAHQQRCGHHRFEFLFRACRPIKLACGCASQDAELFEAPRALQRERITLQCTCTGWALMTQLSMQRNGSRATQQAAGASRHAAAPRKHHR